MLELVRRNVGKLLHATELASFARAAFFAADRDTDGVVGLREFLVWHPGYEARLAAYHSVVSNGDATALAQAKASLGVALAVRPDGAWETTLKQLQHALDEAWAQQRTPLLVDATQCEGSSHSQLETFYSYSGDQLLELKKMVVEVNMTKVKSVEDALGEAREKLVRAMKYGTSLVMLCSSAAPPMTSKFTAVDTLPLALFDAAAVQAVRGPEGDTKTSWAAKVLRPEDGVVFVKETFNVIVVTKFDVDDYAEFLQAELPMDLLQPIIVRMPDTPPPKRESDDDEEIDDLAARFDTQ